MLLRAVLYSVVRTASYFPSVNDRAEVPRQSDPLASIGGRSDGPRRRHMLGTTGYTFK